MVPEGNVQAWGFTKCLVLGRLGGGERRAPSSMLAWGAVELGIAKVPGHSCLNMTAVFLGMGVDRVRSMPYWARLKHSLVLMKAWVGVRQAWIGFNTQ